MKYQLQQIWEKHNLEREAPNSLARKVFADIAGEWEKVAERQRERLEALVPSTDSTERRGCSDE